MDGRKKGGKEEGQGRGTMVETMSDTVQSVASVWQREQSTYDDKQEWMAGRRAKEEEGLGRGAPDEDESQVNDTLPCLLFRPGKTRFYSLGVDNRFCFPR